VTSALLKLPRSMSKAQKLARVDTLLELLVRFGGGGMRGGAAWPEPVLCSLQITRGTV
jgi:hypothetical protein